jgi:hypothetical protein
MVKKNDAMLIADLEDEVRVLSPPASTADTKPLQHMHGHLAALRDETASLKRASYG